MVILSAKEFDIIIDELEDMEDIRLYDDAKKSNTGERIKLSDYLIKRNLKNE